MCPAKLTTLNAVAVLGTETAVDKRVLVGCIWVDPEHWKGSSAGSSLY